MLVSFGRKEDDYLRAGFAISPRSTATIWVEEINDPNHGSRIAVTWPTTAARSTIQDIILQEAMAFAKQLEIGLATSTIEAMRAQVS